MSNDVTELPIQVRDVRVSDLNMILKSWKFSLRSYSPELGDGDYFRLMNAVCEEVMAGHPSIFVACAPDEPNVILGWLCAEAAASGLILWMANVPKPYRRQRVATRLLHHCYNTIGGDDAGPRTFYAPSTRFNDKIEERLDAEPCSWAKALRMRRGLQ
jgi:hypothetical protein